MDIENKRSEIRDLIDNIKVVIIKAITPKNITPIGKIPVIKTINKPIKVHTTIDCNKFLINKALSTLELL